MKIKILGTAAAEGWPGLFCGCESCQRARQAGGKNIRSRSGALIDDDIKIDFGPDTYHHVLTHGLDLGKVKHLIMTHAHSDHFTAAELEYRYPPFAHLNDHQAPVLQVWGNQTVLSRIEQIIGGHQERYDRYKLNPLTAFTPASLDDTTVTPLKADHDQSQDCFIYVIERNGKRILYGHDTGFFPEETWDYLEQNAPYLNLVLLDCTFGGEPGDRGHMGKDACVAVQERLLQIGCADEQTTFVATHFSHNGKLLHHELERVFAPHRFVVAYDGITFQL